VQLPEYSHVFGSDLVAVMDNAVRSGVSSCEYGSEALIRRVPAGITIGKLDSLIGQFIDVGTGHGLPSVTTEVSGSEGVDDDENDIGVFLFLFFHAGSLPSKEGLYYGTGK
jgi:hypothetical protein